MSLAQILAELSSLANSQNQISAEVFKSRYTVLENAADGNCLFLSIAQLDPRRNHRELRKAVCDYYKTFDPEGQYPPDSLEEKLQIAYITDNTEYHRTTGRELKVKHDKRICKNLEYAGIMDIIVLCIIIQKNVLLFSRTDDDSEGADIEPYSFGAYEHSPGAETLLIRFNGTNHYEALIPIGSGLPESSVSSESSSHTSSTGKKSNTTTKRGRAKAKKDFSKKKRPSKKAAPGKKAELDKKSSPGKKGNNNTQKRSRSRSRGHVDPNITQEMLNLRALKNKLKYENDIHPDEQMAIEEQIREIEAAGKR